MCGNEVCESDVDEDCSVCPKDCGRCPLESWEIGLIAASVLMIFVVIGIIYLVSVLHALKQPVRNYAPENHMKAGLKL